MSSSLRNTNQAMLALRLAGLCVIAVLISIYFNLAFPFWSVVTILVLYSDRSLSPVTKAILRVSATVFGSLLALAICTVMINSKLFMCLSVFLVTTITSYNFYRSRYPYLWLLGGATAFLVLLGGWVDPSVADRIALWRSVEVIIGVLLVMLNSLFFPPVKIAERVVIVPAANIGLRAIKAGIACVITTLFLIYTQWYEGSIGVVSAFVVILKLDRVSAWQVGVERLLGCLIGAVIGLFLLCFVTHSIFSLVLSIFVITAIYVYHMPRQKADYAKLQLMMAFLVVVLPVNNVLTTDVFPALQRLFGILLGVTVSLLVVEFIFPSAHAPQLLADDAPKS